MRRLIVEGPATVMWEEVDDPPPPMADQAIVRPIAVATCDLDVAVLRGRFPAPGAPYAFGHEAVVDVVAVGPDVRTVAPGDRAVVTFQISCGTCTACQRGRTGNCESHPRMSTYGLGNMGGYEWGGLLTDLAVVPHADAMLVPVPHTIDAAVIASASDNLPDAWRTVAPHLAAEPGADVLVIGGAEGPNSIGLYAAGIAVALNASRVVYHDDNPERLAIAVALGAEPSEGAPPHKLGVFPITVDASGNEAGLRCALNSTASDGTCTSPSVYLADPSVPMLAMYSRCCTLHTGRVHARPAIPRVLELVAAGFDPSLVTSAVVPWDDAPAALEHPQMKLVISREAS